MPLHVDPGGSSQQQQLRRDKNSHDLQEAIFPTECDCTNPLGNTKETPLIIIIITIPYDINHLLVASTPLLGAEHVGLPLKKLGTFSPISDSRKRRETKAHPGPDLPSTVNPVFLLLLTTRDWWIARWQVPRVQSHD